MDADVTRAAEAIAEHALLLLALAIVIVGLAVGALMVAVRVTRRHRRRLTQPLNWLLIQVRRIPSADRYLGRVRNVVPPAYVAVHLVLGLIATAAVIGFAVIAEEVVAGNTIAAFDRAFAEALHRQASPGWQRAFRTITSFGSTAALAAASTLVAIGLLIFRRYVMATGWIIALSGAGLLIVTLKGAFARTRPPLPDAQFLASWSFPSGHALATFVFCGMGAYLILRSTRSWGLFALVATGALAWCIVMSFTRLYLGVHFASDVIAGLIAATAWVAVCASGVELGLRQVGRNGKTGLQE
jgi:membrane-associated phospholipid phosphatase